MTQAQTPTPHRLGAFAYELGVLRFIPRDFILNGVKSSANVAEHTYRVAMLAWYIAQQEGADVGKTVQMALVHDLPEARTLDHGIVSSQYVVEHDAKAAADMFGDLLPEGFKLWNAYEERECLESKIVKDADRLDVTLECLEQKCRGLSYPDYWDEEMKLYPQHMHTQTAKDMFEAIWNTHPMDWARPAYMVKLQAVRQNTSHKLKAVK